VAKPAVEVFELVIARLDVSPTTTVFIDDMEENVAGARAAGLHATLHVDVASTAALLAEMGV